MTQYRRKWLMKCIRTSAAMVEKALFYFDNRFKTVSSQWAIHVAQICIFMPFSLSEGQNKILQKVPSSKILLIIL
jgi:hypothetical protein